MGWLHQHIANAISFSRIIFSPLLVFFALLEEKTAFGILALLLFASDAVDGTIARRFKTESDFGHMLDTIADFIFYPAVLLSCFYIFREELARHYLLVVVPVFFLTAPKIIGLCYTKNIPNLHTRIWQFTTYVFGAWLAVSLLQKFNLPLLWAINGLSILAGIDEALIFLTGKNKTDQRVHSYWEVLKERSPRSDQKSPESD